jgi:hypothetical protein
LFLPYHEITARRELVETIIEKKTIFPKIGDIGDHIFLTNMKWMGRFSKNIPPSESVLL